MKHKYLPLSEPSCYIMQSIYNKPKHGYAIVQDIKRMSDEALSINNGTLYVILKRMEEDHLIETKIFESKKIYHITKIGEDILYQEYQRIRKIMQNFKQINFIKEAVPNFKKASFYFNEAKKKSYDIGKLTGFEPEYILSFLEPISTEFEKELSSLGCFKKVKEKIYKLKTPLTKIELVAFIVEGDNLKPTDFNVDQLGELYVLI